MLAVVGIALIGLLFVVFWTEWVVHHVPPRPSGMVLRIDTYAATTPGDERKSVDSLPAVPDRYRRWLVPEPIEARIFEVQSGTRDEHGGAREARLDRGANTGMIEDMPMRLVSPSGFAVLTVLVVEEESSTASVRLQQGTVAGRRVEVLLPDIP